MALHQAQPQWPRLKVVPAWTVCELGPSRLLSPPNIFASLTHFLLLACLLQGDCETTSKVSLAFLFQLWRWSPGHLACTHSATDYAPSPLWTFGGEGPYPVKGSKMGARKLKEGCLFLEKYFKAVRFVVSVVFKQDK
jgi:hypothetical protein